MARDEAQPDSDIDILVDLEPPITFDHYMDVESLLWIGKMAQTKYERRKVVQELQNLIEQSPRSLEKLQKSVWQIGQRVCCSWVHILLSASGIVYSVAFSPDGKTIASGNPRITSDRTSIRCPQNSLEDSRPADSIITPDVVSIYWVKQK